MRRARRAPIRSRRCAVSSRSSASTRKASSISMATRSACCRRPRPRRVRQVVEEEWGVGPDPQLERPPGWITLSQRIADKIARADRRRTRRSGGRRFDLGQSLQGPERGDRHCRRSAEASGEGGPNRTGPQSHRLRAHQLSHRSLHRRHPRARARASSWCSSIADEIAAQLDDRLAILMLTHVNYRTGRMHRHGRADARGARCRRAS